ncbi:hypothetical protein ACHAXR_006437 [Thalassiosira sp. AJA248-18]
MRSFWECLDHCSFTIDLDYPTQQPPREGDKLLNDLFQGYTSNTKRLSSLNRCRISWEMIFLSDAVTANGRRIDTSILLPPDSKRTRVSKFDFQEERPTVSDWVVWTDFWRSYTLAGYHLESPLGDWVHPSHMTWKWFYDPRLDRIEHLHDSTVQGCALQHRASAQWPGYTSVRGPSLAAGSIIESDFFSHLKQYGGEWMWTNIRNEGCDLQWVKDAMEEGTGIWVTDGSYNKKIAPFVSGAGWLFYCTRKKKRLMGSFLERSPKAGSYRGELLGLLACHTLHSAIEEYFDITAGSSKVCCDNSGALFKSKEFRRRIQTGASHADILRCLRNIKVKIKTAFVYEWVASHQDDLKLWNQLTIEQQLNCMVDTLAKQAVHSSLSPSSPRTFKLTLPHERAAVYVDGKKQTTDVATDVRLQLGMVDAQQFYCRPTDRGGLGWSNEAFNTVDWRVLGCCVGK